jgi:transposase
MKRIVEFTQMIDRGCGLDVHKETVVATIRGSGITEQTKTFGTFTEDLEQLRDWLLGHRITHIAMESTGVYWKPVFNILEQHFEVILVNARHIKYVPGHKTDKKDSAWIAKLLLSGLLKGSFIPPQVNRELRELYRYKRKLIGQTVAERNRLQKILEDANIKLASVITDVCGASGRAILSAIIEGETNPVVLADLGKGSLKKKKAILQSALKGNITDHHRFMLKTIRKSLACIESVIADVDQQIGHYLMEFRQEVELLQTIPGVGVETATGIIAEMGTDMHVFPDHNHLASWAGMCPGNNESAGKKKSERITHGNKSLKTTLTEAAWAASHTKDTFLKRKYNGLVGRRGKKRALIAVGHKILCAVYHILKNKEAYVEPDDFALAEKRKQALIRKYSRRLHELGAMPHLN